MRLVDGARGGSVEATWLAAARAGDEDAFRSLTEPYARELHVHCYRMLGSLHDAEDALQETLLRAWRHLRKFEGRSSFRGWLYKIATNVCLTATTRQRLQHPPVEGATESWEVAHLGPYPDAFLDQVEHEVASPAARYDLRESVQLAFVNAIQLLPPRQRAVLLLRDVLGWSAKEAAELLDSTVASVNSALQRGRETLDRHSREGRLRTSSEPPSDEVQRSLLRRYVAAWEAVDIEALVALLREDAILTMPPAGAFVGRVSIGEFFATIPAGGALDRIRLVETRANRQPALAGYIWNEDDRVYRAYGLMVLTVDGAEIGGIAGFADPTLFAYFGLPAELET